MKVALDFKWLNIVEVCMVSRSYFWEDVLKQKIFHGKIFGASTLTELMIYHDFHLVHYGG